MLAVQPLGANRVLSPRPWHTSDLQKEISIQAAKPGVELGQNLLYLLNTVPKACVTFQVHFLTPGPARIHLYLPTILSHTTFFH